MQALSNTDMELLQARDMATRGYLDSASAFISRTVAHKGLRIVSLYSLPSCYGG